MDCCFLCPAQRGEITSSVERATARWLAWLDDGCGHYAAMRYRQALPYLGCALECSELMLNKAWPDDTVALARFTYSSICLGRAYEQLGDAQASRSLLDYACQRVADYPRNDGVPGFASRCRRGLQARADSVWWVNSGLLATALSNTTQAVN